MAIRAICGALRGGGSRGSRDGLMEGIAVGMAISCRRFFVAAVGRSGSEVPSQILGRRVTVGD